jgi:hypothetical protein
VGRTVGAATFHASEPDSHARRQNGDNKAAFTMLIAKLFDEVVTG